MTLKTVPFGNTDQQVTVVGLGGEGILRTHGYDDQAESVIRKAISEGITYFDSAKAYADSERYYGALWKRHPDIRASVFQTSKSACRDREGALSDLHGTLKRLNTSWLDLWQIHDVRSEQDLKLIAGKGGALEAFVEAKNKGLVRRIGVTGHQDPAILTRAVRQWPVDAVLLPVNPAEEILGGFLTETLEAARKKGIAVIGMKILGASHYVQPEHGVTAELLMRYALSHDITLGIVGCSSPEEVAELAAVGRNPSPLSPEERKELLDLFRPHAERLAYYRGL